MGLLAPVTTVQGFSGPVRSGASSLRRLEISHRWTDVGFPLDARPVISWNEPVETCGNGIITLYAHATRSFDAKLPSRVASYPC